MTKVGGWVVGGNTGTGSDRTQEKGVKSGAGGSGTVASLSGAVARQCSLHGTVKRRVDCLRKLACGCAHGEGRRPGQRHVHTDRRPTGWGRMRCTNTAMNPIQRNGMGLVGWLIERSLIWIDWKGAVSEGWLACIGNRGMGRQYSRPLDNKQSAKGGGWSGRAAWCGVGGWCGRKAGIREERHCACSVVICQVRCQAGCRGWCGSKVR